MPFSETGFDIELLRRYYNNELSDNARNALEKAALEDPFLKDAMDGFDQNPGSFERFYQKHRPQLRPRKSYTLMIAIGVLIGLFAVTSLIKWNSGADKENLAVNEPIDTVQNEIDLVEAERDFDLDVEEYEVVPVEIETLTYVPSNDMISVNEVVIYQEQTQQNKEEEPLEPIVIDEDITPVEDYAIEDEKRHKLGQPTVATSYLYDLMVVDYRQIRRENQKIKYNRFELSGTSADQSGDEGQENELIETEVQVPYYNYLRKSMSFFAESNFKKALNRYLLILEQYPTDLNALFYGGLSYYNLGKYDKSVNFFERILESEERAFTEETHWYKAKSLIKLGETGRARELLNEIIAAGGFYTKQAIELKKTL